MKACLLWKLCGGLLSWFLSCAEVHDESEEGNCDYSDDFEEEEEEEECEDGTAPVHNASADSQGEMVVEIKVCDAGGLSITLKSQKEICGQQKEQDSICHHRPWSVEKWKLTSDY